MTTYETLRGKPRIIVVGKPRDFRIDFVEYMEVTPATQRANVDVSQTISGRVQVLRKRMTSDLRLQIRSLALSEAKKLQQLFDVFAVNGMNFELILDRLRGHRITGDDTRDSATGWKPYLGGTTAYPDAMGAFDGVGGLGFFPAVAYDFERIEYVKNGDILDGASLGTPTNWTNETLTTLGLYKMEYLGPMDVTRTRTMDVITVQQKRDGTKTFSVDFDLGQYSGSDIAYDTPPHGTYNVSFLARVDMEPARLATLNGGGNELLSVALRASDHASSVRDDQQDVALSVEWTRYFLQFTPAESSSVNDGAIVFDVTDGLDGHALYITDVRMTGTQYWSGPAPYSSSRTSAIGTATQSHVVYFNRLLYGNQIPDWEDSTDFGVTFSCWYRPFWSSAAGKRGPEFSVSSGNNKLDFEENSVVLEATVDSGQYAADDLALAVAAAMNAVASTNTYSCTYSTSTNKFTIARATGTDTIDLLWNSGSNKLKSIAALLGFDDSADDTSATSYLADNADSGFLTLCMTCDTTIEGNRAALWIYVTSQAVYAKTYLSDGTEATLSYAHTFTAGTPVHIAYSVSDDETHQLWINGSSVATGSSIGDTIASVGKLLLVGSHVSNYGACCGVISDFRLDPLHIDNSTYTIADYYSASEFPERFQNSWRVKLDRRGAPLVQFDDRENAYTLDARVIEDPIFVR